MLKFADDVNLTRRVDLEEAVDRLRMDLKRLGSWGEKWQRMFRVGKCNVMNFGFRNRKEDYASMVYLWT